MAGARMEKQGRWKKRRKKERREKEKKNKDEKRKETQKSGGFGRGAGLGVDAIRTKEERGTRKKATKETKEGKLGVWEMEQWMVLGLLVMMALGLVNVVCGEPLEETRTYHLPQNDYSYGPFVLELI